ncbi:MULTISPECIES: DUF3221 domain-containing protein [Lysinibacillus]|uniref:DUF3221 domain-containing protein n=1 Tax=Lysinibacillus TaxID=400634 RepID=UPI001CD9AE87|nr:DUF3221 domain-containing protein [Lysinibacillus capsici]MCT1540262.1 YobA family protein [Lysinibacillus capsici]MCT1571331.1 YobA family protein [Lysinibacillus capsici]MCT1647879.1 YobA family protein [Lysinibacillus capsici]MCT1726421.1 YobA family protein [Lysinibacillus capsici]MCT1783525.1 YobA family protein [Lysinibacillus capsici]
MKNRIHKPIFNTVLLLLFLVALWFLGNVSQLFASKENTESEIGYIVMHEGIVYFIQGKDVQQSDIESFSSENLLFSNKFESVSILINESKLSMKGIKSGDEVRIWYSEILESNPAKIKVIRIEKL